jgi:hypothetical protein
VVESTRLESERTGNRTVGSNPTLSASSFIFFHLQIVVSIMVSALHRFPANDRRERGLQTCPSVATVTAAKIASIS